MKISNTATRLRELMLMENLRQVDILERAKPYCDEFGVKLGKNDLSQYINGKVEPGKGKLSVLARALGVSEDWLFGLDVPGPYSKSLLELAAEDNGYTTAAEALKRLNIKNAILPLPSTVRKPRLGAIACGTPIEAIQNADEFDDVPDTIDCDFTLLCKGDSMINARIFDGDVVYIKFQPEVENGQIAAVLIDGEATLKRVYYYPDQERLVLRACNPMYADMVYSGQELEQASVIGLAVGFFSLVRHEHG